MAPSVGAAASNPANAILNSKRFAFLRSLIEAAA